MGFLRRKYEEKKSEVKQGFAARAQIKKKARAKYFQAKEKEAERESVQRARIETDARLKRYKESKNKPGFSFDGLAGPTQKNPNMGLGVADYLTGGSKKSSGDLFGLNPVRKPQRRKRKNKISKNGRSITIKL